MPRKAPASPTVFSAAGVYIMAIIGAGFASGQEIYSFFFVYGPLGLAGALVAGIMLVWYGRKVFILGNQYSADLCICYGRYFSQVLRIIFGIFSAAMLTVMLSCMNLLNSNFEKPSPFYVVLSCGICYISLLGGSKFLNFVGSLLSPVMTIGIIGLCGYAVIHELISFGPGAVNFISASPPKPFSLFFLVKNFLFSALLYVGYNCLSTFPVLFSQGALFNGSKKAGAAGVLGGAVLALLLVFLTFSLFVFSRDEAMPLLHGIAARHSAAGTLYKFILYAAVYTSAISLLYGLVEFLRFCIPPALSGLIICVLCGAFSLFGFKELIDVIYPLFGYIGAAFICILAFKKHGTE